MKRVITIVAILGLTAPGAVTLAENAPDDDGQKSVACVTHKTEARFVGVAYNHLVHFENNCTYSVACDVKTDVNPKTETVNLSPKEKKTHLTYRGSPARVFKATVKCRVR